eukprot:TRINITY_DN1665_c0_g2_i2.p1 TRINITY_DN1665_c0_g2~~TRINITY_DN1665_c0_g2_i2.p1  ORF type:complete len:422 (-),score=106.43 TRINITY_DN1665_c0_g2_i2:160-1425(-)
MSTKAIAVFYQRRGEDTLVLTRKSSTKPNAREKFIEAKLKKTSPSPIFDLAEAVSHKTSLKLSACNTAIWEKVFDRPLCAERNEKHLWNQPCFRFWLGRISRSDDIFYHSSGTSVYFIELSDIKVEEFNSMAASLPFALAFKLVSELKEQSDLSQFTAELLDSLPRPELIPRKRYLLLNCEPRPIWENLYEALYMGLYRRPGTSWTSYEIFRGEFPPTEVLANADGMIISGSKESAYDTSIQWLNDLREMLKKVHDINSNIKIIGICFGHQLTSLLFGGEVKKMPLADDPFILGLEKVNLTPVIAKDSGISKSQLIQQGKAEMNIIAFHGDEVTKASGGLDVVGSSASTKIEMCHVKEKFLTFQCHPEFNHSFLKFYLDLVSRVKDEKFRHFADRKMSLIADEDIERDLATDLILSFLEAN